VRVVFDANILVSALILPGGSGDRALNVILDGRATLLLSKPILGETLRVLGKKFARETEELARLAVFFADLAEIVAPTRTLNVLADEPDNRILECAQAGGAALIATGDRAMLALRRFAGTEIITLRDFLRRLARAER
jgi:putative PIN family toxin of toxin-antitoxin system